MTEYDSFHVQKMNNMCRACLKITDEVYPMTANEIKMYNKFSEKISTSDRSMLLCIICKWMIRKCTKFGAQVRRANDILEEIIDVESKPYLYLQLTTFDLAYTQTETSYIGPQLERDNNSLSEREEYMMSDGINDDDEDEIPLLMLQDYKSKKRKVDVQPTQDIEIKLEEVNEEVDSQDSTQKRSRKKKKLKEGFTSRMVQETDEYVVIKLTPEQVTQELSEKSKTDAYIRAPYKCDKCVKGFNFEDVLLTHMEKHRKENGPYECSICSQYCPSPVSLRGHMKSHTTRYKCKVCGQIRLSRQHLLEHYNITHTSAPITYSCDKCQFTTNKRTVIQRHVKSHSTVEKHACDTCGKLFGTIESLRVHTMRHNKSKRLQCEQCNKCFIYPSLLHKHIAAVHDRKDYYCVECDVSFKSPESLRLHFKKAKRHRDSSSFRHECPQCHLRFVSTATLAVHLTTTHGEPKQHCCDICNNYYSSKEALRTHIWRVHSNKREPPANCDICDKTFSRKSVLRTHVRTHTGARAHVCACGAAFAQRATLLAHRAAKHDQKQDIQPPDLEVQAN